MQRLSQENIPSGNIPSGNGASSTALGSGGVAVTERPAAEPPGTRGRFFRPELDVLRFFAFSLVFLSHSLPSGRPEWAFLSRVQAGSGFGVPVFFLLSAFLITDLLTREKTVTGAVHVRAFYVRRILRIWPLYFLALFLAFFVPRFTHAAPDGLIGVRQLLAYLFLIGNWDSVFHGALPYVGALWSLSVEEQFYLIWPALVRVSARKAILSTSVAIWAVSQMVVIALCVQHRSDEPIWFNTFVQMQYFAIGAALSIVLCGKTPKLSWIPRLLLVIAGLGLFIAWPRAVPSYVAEYFAYLAAGLGATLIFLGFLGATIPPRLRLLQYFGKISYGLYIIHVPVLDFLFSLVPRILHTQHLLGFYRMIGAMIITIALASLSYRYFEKPFLRLKERFEVVPSRTA